MKSEKFSNFKFTFINNFSSDLHFHLHLGSLIETLYKKSHLRKMSQQEEEKSFANYSDNVSRLIYRVFRSLARARTFHLIIGMKIFFHLNLIYFLSVDTLRISREKRLSSVGGGRKDVTVACVVDDCLISVCMIAWRASQTQDFLKLRPAASAFTDVKKFAII